MDTLLLSENLAGAVLTCTALLSQSSQHLHRKHAHPSDHSFVRSLRQPRVLTAPLLRLTLDWHVERRPDQDVKRRAGQLAEGCLNRHRKRSTPTGMFSTAPCSRVSAASTGTASATPVRNSKPRDKEPAECRLGGHGERNDYNS